MLLDALVVYSFYLNKGSMCTYIQFDYLDGHLGSFQFGVLQIKQL